NIPSQRLPPPFLRGATPNPPMLICAKRSVKKTICQPGKSNLTLINFCPKNGGNYSNDFDVIHYEGGENDGNIEISFNPATETPYTPERGGMIGERIAPGEWNTSWRGASGAATAGHYGELLPLPKLALGKYLGKLMGWGGKKAAQESVEQGSI